MACELCTQPQASSEPAVHTAADAQEQGGDAAVAAATLRAALQWWRDSMVEPPAGIEHPEHWLLQVIFRMGLRPSSAVRRIAVP